MCRGAGSCSSGLQTEAFDFLAPAQQATQRRRSCLARREKVGSGASEAPSIGSPKPGPFGVRRLAAAFADECSMPGVHRLLKILAADGFVAAAFKAGIFLVVSLSKTCGLKAAATTSSAIWSGTREDLRLFWYCAPANASARSPPRAKIADISVPKTAQSKWSSIAENFSPQWPRRPPPWPSRSRASLL